MKGLLLKELYLIKKYCKMYLLITIVFVGASLVNNDNMFFIFYPCLLCGMIPVNLLSLDERSKWLQYSLSLPYSRAQLVSSKYLIGLFTQIAVVLIIAISQAIKMKISNTLSLDALASIVFTVIIMATVSASISLPFMFKYGVEKGRVAYYAMIGIVCAGGVLASKLLSTNVDGTVSFDKALPLLCLAGIGIYALSWYISTAVFKKREI